LRPVSGLREHSGASSVPAISKASYRSLRGDIERRGLQVPLDVNAVGVVLDGHVRLRAARELGLEQVPVRVVAPADEFEYLLLAALLRRQLSPSQRAALAVELDQYRQVQAAAQQHALRT
jgi:ParB-like chromosome segregation protein Spo0J